MAFPAFSCRRRCRCWEPISTRHLFPFPIVLDLIPPTTPPHVLFGMCSNPGGISCALFTCITSCIAQQPHENTPWVWYATHPRSALAMIAKPSKQQRYVYQRLPSVDSDGKMTVRANISLHGVKLNGSTVRVPLLAAAAHVKLAAALGKCPVRAMFDSNCVKALGDFFNSLQRASGGCLVVELLRLQTTEFGALLERHRLRPAQVLDILRTVVCLVLEGACEVDLTPMIVHELTKLQSLHVSGGNLFSLSALRGSKTLLDIDVSGVSITHRDVNLLGQMAQLRSLVVDGCTGVISLTPFTGHPSLRHLSAAGCPNLRQVGSLGTIPTLEYANISSTAVSSEDLRRGLKGFMGIRGLVLDQLSFGEVEGTIRTHRTHWKVQRLSLKDVRCPRYTWVATAICLGDLYLDGTRLIEREFSLLCSSLIYLERLSIARCMWLVTSLRSLLALKHIREVTVSRRSLLEENGVAELCGRGVRCHICSM